MGLSISGLMRGDPGDGVPVKGSLAVAAAQKVAPRPMSRRVAGTGACTERSRSGQSPVATLNTPWVGGTKTPAVNDLYKALAVQDTGKALAIESPSGYVNVVGGLLLLLEWSPREESNPQPPDYKSGALPLRHSGLIRVPSSRRQGPDNRKGQSQHRGTAGTGQQQAGLGRNKSGARRCRHAPILMLC